MDLGIIEQMLQHLGAAASQMADILGPGAATVAYALLGVAIGMGVLSMYSFGGHSLVIIGELIIWASVARWLGGHWGDVITWAVNSSRETIGLFVPGYGGPSDLFAASYAIAQRIWSEPEGWALSLNGVFGAMGRHMVYFVGGYIVFLGLSVAGVLSILAEITLLITAALAPLTLGFLAFSTTRSIGWAACIAVLNAMLRVIATGLVSVWLAEALASVIDMPGPNEVLDMQGVAALALLSMIAAIIAWQANSIASSLTGGGSMGLGAAMAPFQVASSVISSGASMGASAGGAAAGAASPAAGGAGRAQGAISTSSGTGRAFK